MSKNRLLIVEDETIVAKDLEICLEELGYIIVATASTGDEAISHVEKENPDLVLMDIMIQGDIDGIETARLIHSNFDIPIIYLTAYSDNHILERAKATAPFGFLVKPFRERELLATIEMALYRDKMQKQLSNKEKLIITYSEELKQKNIDLTKEIEEHKRLKEKISADNKRWFSILDELPAIVSLIARDYTIKFSNRSFRKCFGNTGDRLCYRVIFGRNEPCKTCHAQHVFKTKDQQMWEWSSVPEGKVYQMYDYPFTDVDTTEYVLQLGIDITDKKKREEEQLKAQKLESISVLAGGIAHDFNNILTAILGNNQLAMLQSKKEGKICESLENVEKACLRAKDLTKQLLTFSKGGEPVTKASNIVKLVKDSVEFALRGSNVKSELSIAEDIWVVDVDEGQINQVLHNIVINGQQAMPEGGILKVKAENISLDNSKSIVPLKHGKYVKISVEDTGIGIPKNLIEKIFDPYFTTKQMGNGLGLASSFSIIKNHRGLITVNSKVEAGTTFCVFLPASSKKMVDEMRIEDKPIVGSGNILIMDDDEAIRYMGEQVLRFIGYQVECAKDGAEAIEMYKNAIEIDKPYDVVIMDLTVPGGMGGEEAINKLHTIFPKAKAVVSSGYANNPVMSEFEKYGFNGVVSKPFEIKEMNEVLQKVINS